LNPLTNSAVWSLSAPFGVVSLARGEVLWVNFCAMASTPEHRGESVRITWLLGGNGPKQSCTFTGPPEGRLKLALAAKELVEARGHNITRAECYAAITGKREVEDSVVPTFAMWVREWIDRQRKAGGLPPGTITRYERELMVRAVPLLGHLRLTEIDADALREWVTWLKRSRVMLSNGKFGKDLLAENTVRRIFSIASSCLGSAVGTWISVNPAATPAGLRRNPLGVPSWKRHEGIFLSAQESALILAKCHPDLYDIVYVALRTGMRRGELLALRVRDVVFSRTGSATIMVRLGRKADGTSGEPKSETSKRDITTKGACADVLRRLTAGRRPSDAVFTFEPKRRGAKRRRWSGETLGRHWSAAVASAMRCPGHPPARPVKPRFGPTRSLRDDEVSDCGCDGVLGQRPRLHDTRHTHASVLIAQNWPVKKIQRRLGHATFAITMDVYGHLMDLGDDGELDSMEEFFDLSA